MNSKLKVNSCGVVFKLDELMTKHNMSKNHLSRITGFRFETIQGYYNGTISRIDLYVITEFCKIFNCRIEDIIEFIPENKNDD